MKISVIGASAGVGLLTVQRALERGHTITTLSRSLPVIKPGPRLTILQGSATNTGDLRSATVGADAVIVTLGTGRSTKATTLYSQAAAQLVALQQETRTQAPFIVLTGFGAGESAAYNAPLMRILFSLLLKDVYADKTRMEETIAASTMRWVIVRPGRLVDGPLTEQYRVEVALRPGMRIGSIRRADVADHLVKQAEEPTALFQYTALSNC